MVHKIKTFIVLLLRFAALPIKYGWYAAAKRAACNCIDLIILQNRNFYAIWKTARQLPYPSASKTAFARMVRERLMHHPFTKPAKTKEKIQTGGSPFTCRRDMNDQTTLPGYLLPAWFYGQWFIYPAMKAILDMAIAKIKIRPYIWCRQITTLYSPGAFTAILH